ncbi:transposase [Rhodococcus koreensis]|uniref:transposase n=1 Tax=Rhodococcus koreensis TaxID=99653 RepID=UPI00366FE316
MAQRLRVDHQRLQQFVTTSPWMWCRVRKMLSGRACDLIAPDAWVIDDTEFTKDATARRALRQYSGTLSRVGNCQIAVSACAPSDAASAPLEWGCSWDDRSTNDPDTVAAIHRHRASPLQVGDGARADPS